MNEENVRTLDQAIDAGSDGVIECRAEFQHQWRRLTVAHRPGFFTIRQRCTRCRNERERDINERGYVVSKWRRTYRPGYLLAGLGRLDEDHRATLRLASLRNANIVDVVDD
jgi:hypothetical protein